jgi:hypothetical protein
MRHLGSIVLSLLLAPIVYALTGIGLVKMSEIPRHLSTGDIDTVSIALAALMAAGLVYAVLVMARLSPLGPMLAGLGFLAMTAWYIGNRASFTRTIPSDALGVRGAAWAPAGTVMALLAVPLLVTIVSPRRWRRWANPPAAVAAPGYSPPVGPGDEPGYAGTPYPGAPSYAPSYSPSPAYPGSPAYSTAPAYQAATYQTPTSGAPAPGYPAPTSGPPDQASDATTPLPTSGQPPAWPVRDDPADPESTRKLP